MFILWFCVYLQPAAMVSNMPAMPIPFPIAAVWLLLFFFQIKGTTHLSILLFSSIGKNRALKNSHLSKTQDLHPVMGQWQP